MNDKPELDLLHYFTVTRIASVVFLFAATWVLIRYASKMLDRGSLGGPPARGGV